MKEYNIHVGAWSFGGILWTLGFATFLLISVSPWFALMYLLLIPLSYIFILNEKARESRLKPPESNPVAFDKERE